MDSCLYFLPNCNVNYIVMDNNYTILESITSVEPKGYYSIKNVYISSLGLDKYCVVDSNGITFKFNVMVMGNVGPLMLEQAFNPKPSNGLFLLGVTYTLNTSFLISSYFNSMVNVIGPDKIVTYISYSSSPYYSSLYRVRDVVNEKLVSFPIVNHGTRVNTSFLKCMDQEGIKVEDGKVLFSSGKLYKACHEGINFLYKHFDPKPFTPTGMSVEYVAFRQGTYNIVE